MLSKTDFMNYVECPVYLWLSKNQPNALPEDGPEKERIFAMGREVDSFAKTLFPGGMEIEGFGEAGFKQTMLAIKKEAKVLFQPTAMAEWPEQNDDISARADILVKNEEGGFDMYEVKMATKVQKEYVLDVGFQKICFERAGVAIGQTFLVHINSDYVRQGDVEPQKLFTIENITNEVNVALEKIQDEITRAFAVMSDVEVLPEKLINSCSNPKWCEYLKCYKAWVKQFDDDIVEPFTKINVPGIKKDLEKLEYPLYFFDYETYSYAIPPFDGVKPYQQIPFQYSLHIKESPNSELVHREFLAEKFENPMHNLLEHLKKDMGPVGSVVVWYAQFESSRNKEMAIEYPEFADFLQSVNARMYDLMLLFKFKNQLYVKSEFNKLASLKIILPVLCPELSYKDLKIQEGGTASASWPVAINTNTPKKERQELFHAMLEYCKRDTYAMVAILNKVCEDVALKHF